MTRQLSDTLPAVVGGVPSGKRVQRVAEQLAEHASAFERAGDPRCVFARAYERLSRHLAMGLPGSFEDPDWIAELAEVFAGYYLRALDEQDRGGQPPLPWARVFDAARRGKTSVIEDLLLGMTAHIVHDLPQALGDVGMRGAGGSRIADYHRMNEVLGAAIGPIQSELARRYDPLLGVLDLVAGHYDEILTDYGLRLARAAAWYNAERLAEPTLRHATLQALADSPAITLRELLEPPLLSLQLACRAGRVASRAWRRYPTPPATRFEDRWAGTLPYTIPAS